MGRLARRPSAGTGEVGERRPLRQVVGRPDRRHEDDVGVVLEPVGKGQRHVGEQLAHDDLGAVVLHQLIHLLERRVGVAAGVFHPELDLAAGHLRWMVVPVELPAVLGVVSRRGDVARERLEHPDANRLAGRRRLGGARGRRGGRRRRAGRGSGIPARGAAGCGQ